MKALWQYFSGKKREMAHIYWAVVIPGSVIWWPEGVPVTAGKIIAIAGLVFTAFGYTHAAVKAKKKKQ